MYLIPLNYTLKNGYDSFYVLYVFVIIRKKLKEKKKLEAQLNLNFRWTANDL